MGESVSYERSTPVASEETGRPVRIETIHYVDTLYNLRLLVYLVTYDSG